MFNRIYIFLFFLLLIGFISSFYSPAIEIKIKANIYRNTASPYSIDWTGTSLLVEILANKSIDVIIVDKLGDFIKEASKDGLVLIIAPDYRLTNETINVLNNFFLNGSINIAIFDENITSNEFLEKYGVMIDGRSILWPFSRKYLYYPTLFMRGPRGETVTGRLNLGSPLNISKNSLGIATIFAYSLGILDLNDNGKLDYFEENASFINKFPVGALFNYSVSKLLVFGDSFFLLNQALRYNNTVSNILIEYIIALAREKHSRIIIPNFIYRSTPIEKSSPFHISILFLLLAKQIRVFDKLFDQYILGNRYLLILVMMASTLSLTLLYRYFLNIRGVEEYKATVIENTRYIVGSDIVKSVLSKEFLHNKEKNIIEKLWTTLIIGYRDVKGIDIAKIMARKDYEVLYRIGFSKKNVKELIWLYNIYLKTTGKKYLPIIIDWRKTLFKYIYRVEDKLNMIGYTVLNKRGYHDVSTFIK